MDFIHFARSHGVEIDPSKLAPGDRIRRCGTTMHPRSTNGAYLFDGERGFVFAWDGEARAQWWNDPKARAWTKAEKQAWRARRDRARADAERGHQAAAQRAESLIRDAKVDTHNYLAFKGLAHARGLVLADGALLVPMRNVATNALQGTQLIRWIPDDLRYEKKMLPGMRARLAVLRLGPARAAETVLCEGYATGLSIEMALRQLRLDAAVLVCFSDSNMVAVAEATTGRRYVFADNDKSGAGQRAAEATGLAWCMSPIEGEDANDLHVRGGLLGVCALLMQARRAPAAGVR